MATTIVPKLFTWQFTARKMLISGIENNSILIKDGLALTIVGRNIREARAQYFTPDNSFRTRSKMIYITKKTNNTYPTIQEMIMREEPTITSTNGFVLTSRK